MKVDTRGQKIRNLLPMTAATLESVWDLVGVIVDVVWDETAICHYTMQTSYSSVMKLGFLTENLDFSFDGNIEYSS